MRQQANHKRHSRVKYKKKQIDKSGESISERVIKQWKIVSLIQFVRSGAHGPAC